MNAQSRNQIICLSDESVSSGLVKRCAANVADFLGANLKQVTVDNTGKDPSAGILAELLGSDDVIAAVLGSHSLPSKPGPLGHVAAAILTSAPIPLVVVPPTAVIPPPESPRILVPLDADQSTGQALAPMLARLRSRGATVLPVHVFTSETLPPFISPENLEVLGRELARKHQIANGTETALRLGNPAEEIIRLSKEQSADVLLVAWSQNLTPGRAGLFLHLLSSATVPIIAVPIRRPPRDGTESEERSSTDGEVDTYA